MKTLIPLLATVSMIGFAAPAYADHLTGPEWRDCLTHTIAGVPMTEEQVKRQFCGPWAGSNGGSGENLPAATVPVVEVIVPELPPVIEEPPVDEDPELPPDEDDEDDHGNGHGHGGNHGGGNGHGNGHGNNGGGHGNNGGGNGHGNGGNHGGNNNGGGNGHGNNGGGGRR